MRREPIDPIDPTRFPLLATIAWARRHTEGLREACRGLGARWRAWRRRRRCRRLYDPYHREHIAFVVTHVLASLVVIGLLSPILIALVVVAAGVIAPEGP